MKKKIETIKDLSLDKITVSKLNEEELNAVDGGAASWTLLNLCPRSFIDDCNPPKDEE